MINGCAATIVAVAALATSLLLAAAMYLVFDAKRAPFDAHVGWLFAVIPPAFLLALVVRPKRGIEVSRWMSASIRLVALHLCIAGLGWVLWRTQGSRIEYARHKLPLVDSLPVLPITLFVCIAVVSAAIWVTRAQRRLAVPRWLRFVAAFSLANFLLLGLSLPVAAAAWGHCFAGLILVNDYSPALHAGLVKFAALAVFAPALVASVVAFKVSAKPDWLLKRRGGVAAAVVVAFLLATACRLTSTYGDYLAYANLIPVLVAEAVIALMSIASLLFVQWRILRRTPTGDGRWISGTVISSLEWTPGANAVGRVEYYDFWGGIRTSCRGFSLDTKFGTLEIPAGAHLLAPIPSWTTSAFQGTRGVVLRDGDTVDVLGFVEPSQGDAYRESSTPMLGTQGVVVAVRRMAAEPVARDLVYLIWRPCVTYLLIASIVAVPGVLALLVVK